MLLVAAAVAAADDACVRCPSCLQQLHSGCIPAPLRRHKDCRNGNALCSRHVYECPGTGFFFTHPTVRAQELSELYSTGFHGRTAKILNPNHPRPVQQAAFISHHFPHISKQALVVEIGCSYGSLIKNFALPTRTLVCFEPTPATAKKAEEVLKATGATAHVFNSLWDPDKLQSVVGNRTIDLLMTSHVLEHMPDLCGFTSSLYALLSPNGIVFTEVPNHSREYVQGPQGGMLHLSFATPRGFLLIMEAAGFALGAMSTHRDYSGGVAAHGGWLRTAFIKPNEARLSRTYGLQGLFINRKPKAKAGR